MNIISYIDVIINLRYNTKKQTKKQTKVSYKPKIPVDLEFQLIGHLYPLRNSEQSQRLGYPHFVHFHMFGDPHCAMLCTTRSYNSLYTSIITWFQVSWDFTIRSTRATEMYTTIGYIDVYAASFRQAKKDCILVLLQSVTEWTAPPNGKRFSIRKLVEKVK